jgi:hypothetical protein
MSHQIKVNYTKAEVVFGFCDQGKEVSNKPTPGPSQEGNRAFSFEFRLDHDSKSPSWQGI